MSANPHNANLGLRDDDHRNDDLNAPDDNLSGNELAGFRSDGRRRGRCLQLLRPSTTLRDTKLCRLCLRFPACTSSYASGAPSKRVANRWTPTFGSSSNSSWTKCCNWSRSGPSPLRAPMASPLPWPRGMQLFAGPQPEPSFPNPERGSIRNQDFPEPACAPAESCAAMIRRTIRG